MNNQEVETNNGAFDPNHAGKRHPGGLRGQATMTLQTRQAQRLMRGRTRRDNRNKPEIIGLTRFATLMRWAWRAAEFDDPWADWLLIRIHDTITENRDSLAVLQRQTEERLSAMSNVEIAVAESLEPLEIPLKFSTPYGFLGAYLVAEYDNYARAVLTARHVGLLGRNDAERQLHQGGHLVRSAFHIPARWRYRALTRDSVRRQTPKALEVAQVMGWPPQEVVDEITRAPIAPAIRKPSTIPGTREEER